MIREAILEDLNSIGIIGEQIHKNFLELNKMTNLLELDYIHIYVYEEGEIKGFIEIEEHFEITDIINIAILEKYQKKGIATKLIDFVIKNTKSDKIMLEVNENNIAAINCYLKNGFKEINRRKKYYGNNDALIMERIVK